MLVIEEMFSGTVVVTLEMEVVGCEVWEMMIDSVVVNGAKIMMHTMHDLNIQLALAWLTYRNF